MFITATMVMAGRTLPCGCSAKDLEVRDASGALVHGVQDVDTATGVGMGLLLDAQGNASADPLNPNDVQRTSWTGLTVTCKHGKL